MAVTSRGVHASSLRKLLEEFQFFFVKVDSEVLAQFAQGNLGIISTSSSYDVGERLVWFFCVFTPFFALCPDGRECPACSDLSSLRWPTVVGHRGPPVLCQLNSASCGLAHGDSPQLVSETTTTSCSLPIGGPTQSQPSRLLSSGHNIPVEHRLQRKHLCKTLIQVPAAAYF